MDILEKARSLLGTPLDDLAGKATESSTTERVGEISADLVPSKRPTRAQAYRSALDDLTELTRELKAKTRAANAEAKARRPTLVPRLAPTRPLETKPVEPPRRQYTEAEIREASRQAA